jgi:hypothetical protein
MTHSKFVKKWSEARGAANLKRGIESKTTGKSIAEKDAVLQSVLLLCEPAYRRPHDGRHDPRPLHLLHRTHVPLPRQQVPPHFSLNSFTFNLFYVPVFSVFVFY